MSNVAESTDENRLILDEKTLQATPISERGIKILEGKGELIRMSSLEGFQIQIPVELITPNPKQPRTYFNEEKLSELQSTISAVGQENPIKVVPYEDEETGEIRLYIVDGERRFRVMSSKERLGQKSVICEICWIKDEFDLLLRSLIANESKEDHNPIDRANAYKNLANLIRKEDFELTEADAIRIIAEKLGIAKTIIKNHLILLGLPLEVQNLIKTGDLPFGNALNFAEAKRKFGDKLDAVKLARLLIDRMEIPNEDDGETGENGNKNPVNKRRKITKNAVQDAVRESLISGGNEETAERLRLGRLFLNFSDAISRVIHSGDELLNDNPESKKLLTTMLKDDHGRRTPPEVLRDRLQEAENVTRRLREFVESEIIKVPPLKIPSGKPPFEKYIKSQQKIFTNETQLLIAMEIAKYSDANGGEIVTIAKIAENLGKDIMVIGNNFKILLDVLPRLGLMIETYDYRVKNADGCYVIRPGYRFNWKTKFGALSPIPEEKPSKDSDGENDNDNQSFPEIQLPENLDFEPIIREIAKDLSADRLQLAMAITRATRDKRGAITIAEINEETGLDRSAVTQHASGLKRELRKKGVTIGSMPVEIKADGETKTRTGYFFTTLTRKRQETLDSKQSSPAPGKTNKDKLSDDQKKEANEIFAGPKYKILSAPETKGFGERICVIIPSSFSNYASLVKDLGEPREGEEIMIIEIESKKIHKIPISLLRKT